MHISSVFEVCLSNLPHAFPCVFPLRFVLGEPVRHRVLNSGTWLMALKDEVSFDFGPMLESFDIRRRCSFLGCHMPRSVSKEAASGQVVG